MKPSWETEREREREREREKKLTIWGKAVVRRKQSKRAQIRDDANVNYGARFAGYR